MNLNDLTTKMPVGHDWADGFETAEGLCWVECICGVHADVEDTAEAVNGWFHEHAKDRARYVDKIRSDLEAASPGTWTLEYDSCDCTELGSCCHATWVSAIHGPKNATYQGRAFEDERTVRELDELTDEDAKLIANAPSYIAFLLEYILGLESERAGIERPEDGQNLDEGIC